MTREIKKKEEESVRLLVIIMLCVVVTLLIYSGVMNLTLCNWDERGQFGDMYGGMNALFSGLAFSAVFYAIWLQRKDLKLQAEELRLTRTELEGQKEQLAGQRTQMELQNRTLRRQTFENTFFQLLRAHNDIIDSMDMTEARKPARGREAFHALYDSFTNKFGFSEKDRKPDQTAEDVIDAAYSEFYRNYQHKVGHYFRNLYRILKLIDETDAIEDRRSYSGLIRAQLSCYELALLFYNCASFQGRGKFHALLEKYECLEGIRPKDILREEHKPLYVQAYGETDVSAADSPM